MLLPGCDRSLNPSGAICHDVEPFAAVRTTGILLPWHSKYFDRVFTAKREKRMILY